MTIYVDVVFLENFIMNFSILLSEGIILNLNNGFWKKLISSIIGACFYICSLIWLEIKYFQFFISLIIVFIAFRPKKFSIFVREYVLFYFINFLYGGISFALMNFANDGVMEIVDGVLVGKFSLIFVFSSAFIGLLILYLVLKEKRNHVFKKITIFFDNLKFDINVFLDTGNLLREPYTSKPVIIVEKKALNELILEKCGQDFDEIITGKRALPIGMFLIPYRSLGNNNGFLLGVKPTCVMIEGSKKKYTDLVIGICGENLSDNNKYSGIFGLKTLDEGVCSL